MLAEGLLTEAQAQAHPQRNVIERALGFNGEEVELNTATLRPGDALLLCSDGVSTVLSAPLLGETVSYASSIEDAARALTNAALARGTDDNATVVVAVRDWANFKARAPKRSILRALRSGLAGIFAGKLLSQKAILFTAAALLLALLGGILVASLNSSSGGGGGIVATVPPPAGSSGANTGSITPTKTASPATVVSKKYELVKGKSAEVKYMDSDDIAHKFSFSLKISEETTTVYLQPDIRRLKYEGGGKNTKPYYILGSKYLESARAGDDYESKQGETALNLLGKKQAKALSGFVSKPKNAKISLIISSDVVQMPGSSKGTTR
jgi:sulfur transfer complex TusBCD TusB component (DsrH family)